MDKLRYEWVKKESSKYKGKYYYFNKKTGESLWNPPDSLNTKSTNATKVARNDRAKPKLSCADKLMKVRSASGVKKIKNPAQDRLAKLQAKLIVEQTKNPKVNFDCTINKTDRTEKQKVLKAENNVDVAAIRTTNYDCKTDDNVNNNKIIEPQKITKSNLNKTMTTVLSQPATEKEVRSKSSECINVQESEKSNYLKRRHGTEPENSTFLTKIPRLIGDALCKLPKIIKNTFQTASPSIKAGKNVSITTPIRKGSELITSEITYSNSSKPLGNKGLNLSNSRASPKLKNKLRENLKCKISASKSSPHKAVSKLLPLQTKPKSANERLQNLRQQLKVQTNVLEGCENSVCSTNTTTSPLNYTLIETREFTPMEWESIEEQIDEKITEIRQDRHGHEENEGILGDLYSVVNHNLLKIAAEESKCFLIKGNQFYFIVDTNVFLRNLTFIEDLRKMKFCGTESSAIIVPYCVLQELDRIKQRSSNAVSTLAVRAIKYLNEKFESKDDSVRGQNAIEANRHLITIENADDSILNCCLQIKEKTSKFLLLTNDVNLRNKAICNSIPVSTKSDLETVRNFDIT